MTQQRGVVLRRLHLFLEVISMDNRLKEIVDNFDSLKIGVDEPFRFHCTMCGKCCINREDILLTPRDICIIIAGSHRGISKMQINRHESRDSTVKTTKNRTVLLFRCSNVVRAAGSKILAAFFHKYSKSKYSFVSDSLRPFAAY